MLVEQAASGRRRAAHRPQPVRRRDVSARRDAARRSGEGVRHDHRGLQRVLQLLRRARTRAATSGCGRRPTSWPRSARPRRAGQREVQLLGQIVNHYQAPDDPGVRLHRHCSRRSTTSTASSASGSRARIRGTSTTRFLDAMRDLPKVCQHLHLPVQSGSTRVLEAMRRRYTRESYLELVARIRETLPDVALSTDMIVGFPGETDADFEETLSLTAAVRYHSMFSFKYSPRPNTLAEQAAAGRCAARTRRRGGSWRCRRCSGRFRRGCNAQLVGRDGRRPGRRREPAARHRSCRAGRAATSS